MFSATSWTIFARTSFFAVAYGRPAFFRLAFSILQMLNGTQADKRHLLLLPDNDLVSLIE